VTSHTNASLSILLLALAACTATKEVMKDVEKAEEGPDLRPLVAADGLDEVTGGPFRYEYAKPGAKLGAYQKLLVDPAELAHTKGFDQGAADSQDLARMKRYLQRVVEKTLSKHYPLVDEPGADVLRVKATVLNLHFRETPEEVDFGAPNLRYYVMIRSVALIAELRDSKSGEILYRLADEEFVNPDYGGVSLTQEVKFWGDLEMAFDMWAKKLRDMLQHAWQ
jgi:hypothetical protein